MTNVCEECLSNLVLCDRCPENAACLVCETCLSCGASVVLDEEEEVADEAASDDEDTE